MNAFLIVRARLFRISKFTSTWILGVAFSALQIAPLLFPGDRVLTGEGRLFALHMFDARVTCEGMAILKKKDGTRRSVRTAPFGETRTACDPIVSWNLARNLCRALPGDVVDLDLILRAKRTSETAFHLIVESRDFCTKRLSYSVFRHNDWIVDRLDSQIDVRAGYR